MSSEQEKQVWKKKGGTSLPVSETSEEFLQPRDLTGLFHSPEPTATPAIPSRVPRAGATGRG